MKISVVGLGKVGSAMLAVFASKGYEVIGFDLDPKVRECVRNRSTLAYEPKVKELFEANHSRITIEESLEKSINETDVTFIIVPTPSKASGGFDTRIIEEILIQISATITANKFHLIVISSTIMPGDMAGKLNAILYSTKINSKALRIELVYSPEFIALGSVVDNLLHPQFVLIGQNTLKYFGESKGSRTIKDIKQRVTNAESPIHVVSYESAEIAKISCNTFLTTKVSYANLISQIAQRISGADTNEIFRILNSDDRIGNKFFSPGLGYGGPCLPRDNQALDHILKNLEIECDIPSATHEFNANLTSTLFNSLSQSENKSYKKALVLGIAYKPGTSSIMESHALKLAEKLYSLDCEVVAHDYLVDFTSSDYNFFSYYSNTLDKGLLKDVSHVFIAHPVDEYYDFVRGNYNSTYQIIDPWRRYN